MSNAPQRENDSCRGAFALSYLCFRRFVDIGMQPCLKMNGIHFPGFEFGHVREVYRIYLFHLHYF